jgi:rRNA processing protein Gar1
MHRLGTVENISYNGTLIVKARFTPKKGSMVEDRKMNDIGVITRIFGPVKTPFVSIRPIDKSALLSLIGSEVYIKKEE